MTEKPTATVLAAERLLSEDRSRPKPVIRSRKNWPPNSGFLGNSSGSACKQLDACEGEEHP